MLRFQQKANIKPLVPELIRATDKSLMLLSFLKARLRI